MPRARQIKPGFFRNEALAEIPPLGRILFEGLWCIADREGRLEDRPKRIKADVLPYDDCNVDDLLSRLEAKGFIERYSSGKEKYIEVVNFHKHQNPHKDEKPSDLPAFEGVKQTPEENGANTVQAQKTPEEAESEPEEAQKSNNVATPVSPYPCTPILDKTLLSADADENGLFGEGLKSVRGSKWFDENHAKFYALYWRRVDRKKSRDAYEARIKSLVTEQRITFDQAAEFLLDAVKADSARLHEFEDWRANLHPATWLRNARWTDEPPKATKARASPGETEYPKNMM